MNQSAISKLGDLIQGIRITMLTTMDERGNFHSRPMANQQRDFQGDLWFFTDDTTPKSAEIQKENHVNLSFVSPDEHRFVSVSGKAGIVHDETKMKELWNPFYRTWFPKGLETPHLCLIRVRVEKAEYWDTSSRKMVRVSNEKLDLTG